MRIERVLTGSSSFGRIRFTPKVERAIERSKHAETSMRIATWNEVKVVLKAAAEMFDVASLVEVEAMWRRRPEIFRVVDGLHGGRTAMIAYLPLNEVGHNALLRGSLDGRRPAFECVAARTDRPEAVYIWMTWSPGCLAAALPRFAELFREISPEGCPLYSRSASTHGARLNAGIGFEPARGTIPTAPDWLLVIHPEATVTIPEITTRPVRTFEDMAMLYGVRSATYLAEQFCLYSEEFDGNDFCATQLLGFVDGDPAGCVRMRYFGDFVKVERLAVRREYRQSRLAFRLVRDALKLARRKGFSRFYGHARADLVPFWSMFGFREIVDRPMFRFADLDYKEMVLDGRADDEGNVVGLSSDPFVTIRPEGSWGEPGPLELSNLRPSRADLLSDTVKSVSTNHARA